ncbi:MAG: hypothetical protein JJ896_02455 [Rhodothermales bacterium]|nr:hypothetical protein [Rhodothermales bacterium]MBO6778492.1 hypothetical protein [Rhodothermales bacterium]
MRVVLLLLSALALVLVLDISSDATARVPAGDCGGLQDGLYLYACSGGDLGIYNILGQQEVSYCSDCCAGDEFAYAFVVIDETCHGGVI